MQVLAINSISGDTDISFATTLIDVCTFHYWSPIYHCQWETFDPANLDRHNSKTGATLLKGLGTRRADRP